METNDIGIPNTILEITKGNTANPIPPCIKNPEPIKTILDTAKELVYGDRAKAYGHPSDNFSDIAQLWNAYTSIKRRDQVNLELFNAIDIANLNILQKIARLAKNQTHEDSVIDIAGYAATIEKIIIKNKE